MAPSNLRNIVNLHMLEKFVLLYITRYATPTTHTTQCLELKWTQERKIMMYTTLIIHQGKLKL